MHDHQSGNGRPDQPCKIDVHGIDGDRGGNILPRHKLLDERQACGLAQRNHATLQCNESDQHGEAQKAADDQDCHESRDSP